MMSVQGMAQVTTVNIDLSASIDTSITLNNTPDRNGVTCGVSSQGNTNCIVFNVKLNPASDQISFDIIGASGLGSAAYQVNCGTPTSLATPICLNGITTASISFCKNGNNPYTYKISVSSLVKGSADLTLRQFCSGTMSITGLQSASVNWESIFPGSVGQYNNYLSCVSGCSSTTVTPQAGSPAYIDYRVYGSSTSCGVAKADTIRVYTTPAMAVSITPSNPAICSGASTPLTASVTGGNPPYVYSWSTGSSASSITASTIGTYSVTVSDNTTGCAAITQTAEVTAAPTPAAPTAAGTSICAGNSATLTATAPGGTYEWYSAASGGTQLGTGATYTTPTLNSTTTYYVQTTLNGCTGPRTAVTVTVNAIPVAPTASGGSVCVGSTITLTATAPGGTYSWYDAANGGSLLFTGASFTTPALNSTTSYYIQTNVSGCNSARTPVTATVIPKQDPAFVYSSGTFCVTGSNPAPTLSGGSTGTFSSSPAGLVFVNTSTGEINLAASALNTYTIQFITNGTCAYTSTANITVTNAPNASFTYSGSPYCPQQLSAVPAFPTGASAGIFSSTTGLVFKNTSTGEIDLKASTPGTYTVTNTIVAAGGCAQTIATGSITITAEPTVSAGIDQTVCSGIAVSLSGTIGGTATSASWSGGSGSFSNASQLNTQYTPAANETTVNLYLTTNTPGSCAAAKDTVVLYIVPTPAAPTIAGTTICAGQSTTLTASAPGGSYGWYNAATGGVAFGLGNSYSTPPLNNTQTYYVQTTIAGCSSSRTPVTVTVTPLPTAPTVANASICTGNTATLTATAPGGTYQWYDAASGGNLLTSTSVFATPALYVSTSYYVQTTVAGCTGNRSVVNVSVNPAPALPTVLGTTICAGNSSFLTATAPGGNYQWYDAAVGGTQVANNSSFTTPVLNTTTTYYVQTTVAGCTGNRTAVTVNVTPLPAAPSLQAASVCAGNSASLTATAPGGTYQWYDAVSGGNLLTTGSSYQTAILNSSATYYVQTTVNGCTGARAAVSATVIAIPAPPTATGGSVCTGNSLTLNATAPGGTYQWYDALSGGTLLASATSYTTPALTSSTHYFVQTTVSGCTSTRTQVTATVIPIQDPAFTYPSGTFCVSGSNPVPVIAGAGTGTFSASPAGLVFVSTTTGEINVAASKTGSYTIQFVTNGICVYTSSVTVNITNAPNASFSYNSPYCPQQLTALPDFPVLASAGVFSAASGLVFKSNSTGEIDLKKSTPGTYTVTNNIAASGGCIAASASNTVTINPEPTVNAGADQTVCAGTIVSLTGTIGGTATAAGWSGGSGSFSTTSQLTTLYTPGVNETTIKLYLTTDDPAGPCAAAKDSVSIFIIPTPAAPTVNTAAICVGNTALLTATAPGGNYEWYAVATGGTAISNTAVYTTPVLSATTTYYVQSTINTCTGPRAAVTVAVSPKPSINSAPAGEICSSQPLTYQILSDQPGSSYTWSRAIVAGISNPQSGAQSGSTIKEVLTNTTAAGIQVLYQIIPVNNGCTGDTFTHTVLVKPTPAAPSLTNSTPVCVGTALSLFAGSVTGASYQWSGPNNFSSTLQNPVINDVVLASAGNYQVSVTVNGCTSLPSIKTIAPVIAAPAASSNSPVCVGSTIQLSTAGLAGANYQWSGPLGFSSLSQNPSLPSAATGKAGKYFVTAFIAGCAGLTDSVIITVNTPPDPPTILTNSPVCVLDSIVLQATGTTSTRFKWSGPNNFSSDTSSPVIRKASTQNDGTYNVTASTPGCTTTSAASTTVFVNLIPNIQVVSNNGPLCEGGTLSLSANSLAGSSYQWGSSSGFRSGDQNPRLANITAANGETYFVTATRNGCKGDTAFTKVTVVKPAVASAGRDVTVCANNASVFLTGSISGEDTQTGIWTSNGKGSFVPDANTLTALYVPAPEDSVKRSVLLTLTTTNNKVCAVTSSSMQIAINPAPFVNAGSDAVVCANDSLISLQGLVGNAGSGRWQSSGSGTFSRVDADPLHFTYTPSRADIQKGQISFYLTSTDNGNCLAVRDTIQYLIRPIPYVNAGADLILFEREAYTLNPQITGTDLSYLWTPGDYLSSTTIRNPVLTATNNQTYRIKVTGTGNCVVEDEVFVRVLKAITIPNIFSPNGDGIYDLWYIPQLANYPGSTVEVFTRTGQKIFSSAGYDRPWDGTFNGNPVPVATYYYIVRPNFRNLLFSGSVTVIR
ncbi:MAG: gliding motility-associated C-terminal domain-containing protein [Bacteroidetes bacterium]|nr:gliding motility-associated C-terminal domain-containing protein [Bacteroidota bacterium]